MQNNNFVSAKLKRITFVFLSLFIFSCSNKASTNTGINNQSDGGDIINDIQEDVVDGGYDAEEDINDGGNVIHDPQLAVGITVEEISLFQTVSIPLVQAGEQVSSLNSPIIENRAAAITVHVSVDVNWTSKIITAELLVFTNADERLFSDTIELTATQDTSIPNSGFVFHVPGEFVTKSTTFKVRFIDNDAPKVTDGTPHEGRYPSDDTSLVLPVEDDLGGIRLVLVPVIYNIDGSGREPDVSTTQLNIIQTMFENVYPLETINISLHSPVDWPQPGYENSSFDFGDMNSYLRELKESDNADSEVYYFALVRPAETFEDYCSGTCTTGQSYKVTNPDSGSYRVGTGVGFTGERWGWTVLHEMGHMHGLGHAHCNVWTGVDWNYPYSNGLIGVWGYDQRVNPSLWEDPDTTVDFMSYCDDRWVSDYHYEKIFERIIAVNSLKKKKRSKIIRYHLLTMDNGYEKWGSFTYDPPVGELKGIAAFLDSAGVTINTVNIWGISQSHTSQILWAIPPAPKKTKYIELETPASKTSTIIAIP